MKRFLLLFFAVAVLAGCRGAEVSVLRIRVLEPDGTASSRQGANAFRYPLQSERLFRKVVVEDGLAKQWGVSEKEAVARLQSNITVQNGAEESALVLKANGFENETGSTVLNSLVRIVSEEELLFPFAQNTTNGARRLSCRIIESKER